MRPTEMDITCTGRERVEARLGPFTVTTDQDGSAPAPFDLFLASIGTCAGYYAARFCQARGLSTEALRVHLRAVPDAGSGMVARVELDVDLPEGFPERYREALLRAIDRCAVKRHLADPPAVTVAITSPAPPVV